VVDESRLLKRKDGNRLDDDDDDSGAGPDLWGRRWGKFPCILVVVLYFKTPQVKRHLVPCNRVDGSAPSLRCA
jgi:hypothetical protein